MEETRKGNKKIEKKNNRVSEVLAIFKDKKNIKKIAVGILAVVCFVIGLFGDSIYDRVKNNSDIGVSSHESLEKDGNKIVTEDEMTTANLIEKVSPSVVSIITSTKSMSSFYGMSDQEGAGTGIIVGRDGYVLTNKHVVEGANKVSVVLHDGTTHDNVEILGTDPLNDVAFLKIKDPNNLKVVELGDSSSVRVGQRVIAIGNSLGLYQNTVTSGIISGTGRPISAQSGDSVEHLTDLIQTDAAINPGNSGGPLLNTSGQVIGINTAIAESAEGIGFSIPINSTKGSLKSVLAGDGVKRSYLGVSYVSITASVAREYDLSVKKGAYVYNGSKNAVIENSPAKKAGIKNKDVILKVGGIEVGDKGSVSSLVGEYSAGEKVKLTILRDGKTFDTNVVLGSYEG